MNLVRKSKIVSSPEVSGDLPAEFPKLPQAVTDRFPEMKEHEDDLKTWWYDTRTVLTRLQQQVDKLRSDAAD